MDNNACGLPISNRNHSIENSNVRDSFLKTHEKILTGLLLFENEALVTVI